MSKTVAITGDPGKCSGDPHTGGMRSSSDDGRDNTTRPERGPQGAGGDAYSRCSARRGGKTVGGWHRLRAAQTWLLPGGMVGSALILAVSRKALYQTDRCLMLEAGLGKTRSPEFAVNMLSLVRVQRGDGSRAGPWRRRGSLRCSATWFPCRQASLPVVNPWRNPVGSCCPVARGAVIKRVLGAALRFSQLTAEASVDTGFEDAELSKLA